MGTYQRVRAKGLVWCGERQRCRDVGGGDTEGEAKAEQLLVVDEGEVAQFRKVGRHLRVGCTEVRASVDRSHGSSTWRAAGVAQARSGAARRWWERRACLRAVGDGGEEHGEADGETIRECVGRESE